MENHTGGNLPQVCPMVELSIAFNMAHNYSDDFPVGTSHILEDFPAMFDDTGVVQWALKNGKIIELNGGSSHV